jgi:hypothetical protein
VAGVPARVVREYTEAGWQAARAPDLAARAPDPGLGLGPVRST